MENATLSGKHLFRFLVYFKLSGICTMVCVEVFLKRISILVSVLLIAVLFFLPVSAAEMSSVSLNITQPSLSETTYAEMRDFYVYGYFQNSGDPANVRVTLLDDAGQTVRTVLSAVNDAGVTPAESVDMSGIDNSWGTILAVEKITSPGGIANGTNKLLVNTDPGYYLAFVQGGATKEISGSYTDSGTRYPADLTMGEYTIVVEVLDPATNEPMLFKNTDTSEIVGRVSRNIMFGLTNTSLGMFTPEENKNNVAEYAALHNLRMYVDWFPGFFQLPDGSAGYRIPAYWQANNAVEVVNNLPGTKVDNAAAANNTMLIYNIGSTSTTYQLELAAIVQYHLVDSPNTVFRYYDIGESSMIWTDEDTGETMMLAGTSRPFPRDSRVIYTRADSSSSEIPANTVSRLPNFTKTVDTTPYAVTVTQGEYLAFYGVTRPIASSLTFVSPLRYDIDNQISTYVYSGGDTEYTFDGLLTRIFVNADGTLYSAEHTNYEFGHVFTAEQTAAMPPGTTIYTVLAYDRDGNLVDDTTKIAVTVVPADGDAGQTAQSEAGTAALATAVVLALVCVAALFVVLRKL